MLLSDFIYLFPDAPVVIPSLKLNLFLFFSLPDLGGTQMKGLDIKPFLLSVQKSNTGRGMKPIASTWLFLPSQLRGL